MKEAGAHVELSSEAVSGGRATSFEIDGVEVDNGQHVFLALLRSLHRIRAERRHGKPALRLQDRFDARIVARGGKGGRLRAGAFPAPFHLVESFAGYPFLTPAEKLRIGARTALGRPRGTKDEDPSNRGFAVRGRGPASVARSGIRSSFRRSTRRSTVSAATDTHVRLANGVLARCRCRALRIFEGSARASRPAAAAARLDGMRTSCARR